MSTNDVYFFLESDSDSKVIRRADVSINKIQNGHWSFNIFDNVKYKVLTRQTKYGGKAFDEIIYFTSFNDSQIQYLAEKGYQVAPVYLVRTLVRFENLSSSWGYSDLFTINYYEDMKNLL